MGQKKILLFVVLSFLTILSACSKSDSNNIRLCNYRNIKIPDEVREVSDEAMTVYVSMKLSSKEIPLPKKTHPDIVEDGDMVNISLSTDEQGRMEQTLVAGSGELGSELDSQLLGKKVGDKISCNIDGVQSIITIESIFMYAENITDNIALQYFGYDSAEAFLQASKQEIIDANTFEYMYAYLINNSMLRDFYEERSEYRDKVMRYIMEDAVEDGIDVGDSETLDAYFESEFGTTVSDFRQSLGASYDEYLILQEFMRQENSLITESKLHDYYGVESIEAGDNEKELFGIFGKEYALYSIYYEECQEILLRYAIS